MSSASPLSNEISNHIWDTKYRYRKGRAVVDQTPDSSWLRIARAIASAEQNNRSGWERKFYEVLKHLRFLPAGRILAGAGTGHNVTLFNCFVMGLIKDSIPSIFDGLKEGAVTMQQGGGVGYDFSTLRPKGSIARSSNNISSGPVSFMKIWDAMCGTMLSTGARRGAMMATLRCDHPDIMEFVNAKKEPGVLTNFNLSVLVSDAFIKAIREDEEWPLMFPVKDLKTDDTTSFPILSRQWSDTDKPVDCRIMQTVGARELWENIMKSTYEYAEPGVLFIDRINNENNLGYCERISATNPCGEVPLPPYGACDLGSLNLTKFITAPFTNHAKVDFNLLRETTRLAVRMLDNVISISKFPLGKQRQQAHNTRRIGLGIMGLGDSLIMLRLHYGSAEGRKAASEITKTICHESYRISVELAVEKGRFPLFTEQHYLKRPFIQRLPKNIKTAIRSHGIRNSHLLSIAPTGSISILADTISGGVEPVFDFKYTRKVMNYDGTLTDYRVTDYAYKLWKELYKNEEPLPEYFVSATQLSPKQHLAMQASLQPFIDNSISKTINVPEHFPFEAFKDIYQTAYDQGLKGCTTFRPNSVTGSVLEQAYGDVTVHCCTPEREAD